MWFFQVESSLMVDQLLKYECDCHYAPVTELKNPPKNIALCDLSIESQYLARLVYALKNVRELPSSRNTKQAIYMYLWQNMKYDRTIYSLATSKHN